jgi:hypothetical protein
MVKKHLTYCPFKYPYHPNSISWNSRTKSLIIWGFSSLQTWLIFNFYLLFMNAVPELLFLILCGGARWPRWTKEMVSVVRSPPSLHGRLYQKSQSLLGTLHWRQIFQSINQSKSVTISWFLSDPDPAEYKYILYRYTLYTGSRSLSRPAISHRKIYCFILPGFWVIRPWPRPSGNTGNSYLWKRAVCCSDDAD